MIQPRKFQKVPNLDKGLVCPANCGGWLIFYHAPDGTAFSVCSNQQTGCSRKVVLARGGYTCCLCQIVIPEVSSSFSKYFIHYI